MSTHIEYVGFTAEGASRDYRLIVREGAGQPREFVVAVPNEAFIAHRVRYQDGPDLCFKVLAKALAGFGVDAPAHVTVTMADLDAYRLARAPKPPKRRARPSVAAVTAPAVSDTPAARPEPPAERPAPAPAPPKPRSPFGLWRW